MYQLIYDRIKAAALDKDTEAKAVVFAFELLHKLLPEQAALEDIAERAIQMALGLPAA